MTPVEHQGVSWIQAFLSFAVVLGLLGLFGLVLKHIGLKGFRLPGIAPQTSRRLQVVESLPLDTRRRLVIVRCDDTEHVLLLGAGQDIVVKNETKPIPSA